MEKMPFAILEEAVQAPIPNSKYLILGYLFF